MICLKLYRKSYGCYKSQINAAADSSIAVVKDIVKATNNDDEQTDMLVALVDGKEVSITQKAKISL